MVLSHRGLHLLSGSIAARAQLPYRPETLPVAVSEPTQTQLGGRLCCSLDTFSFHCPPSLNGCKFVFTGAKL